MAIEARDTGWIIRDTRKGVQVAAIRTGDDGAPRIRTPGKLSAELIGGERLIEAFIETHPLIEDKIASGEGVRGQFTDSQIAERVLLKGIDIGLCILPIHDGFVTTAGDEIVLETLMNDAFSEVTGHTAVIKPETFDLSVIPDAGKHKPHWSTRSDGTVERDGTLEGKAAAFSQIVSGAAIYCFRSVAAGDIVGVIRAGD